jgi:hypothetical protein
MKAAAIWASPKPLAITSEGIKGFIVHLSFLVAMRLPSMGVDNN